MVLGEFLTFIHKKELLNLDNKAHLDLTLALKFLVFCLPTTTNNVYQVSSHLFPLMFDLRQSDSQLLLISPQLTL